MPPFQIFFREHFFRQEKWGVVIRHRELLSRKNARKVVKNWTVFDVEHFLCYDFLPRKT